MKTRIFFVLAAIGLLASCAKEQAPQNDNVLPGGPDASRVLTTLTVGLPNPDALAPQYTRTHMDPTAQAGKHKVYWSDGDQIAVNGVASQELSDVAEGTQTATFNFEADLETPYRIVYPASISSQTGESVTLPERQTYKADGFAEGMYPMAGYSADGEGITLNPLCAMLKISVKRAAGEGADADDLVAVRFKGKNNEQVCGSFTIDYENATLTGTSSAAADKEVKVVKVQATSVETAAVYYVVVPAGTYSNGFDITVQDNKGHIMTQSKASSVELTSGALYVMPEFTFVPTATELGVEIASAEDLISFATNYNNKVYDALGDALIATLTADITFDATTSAAYEATNGIGNVISTDVTNYFHGLFNGQNHTISGYTGSVPLFAYSGSTGIIENIILAADCDKVIAADNANDLFGAFVGYHKGLLQNCVSHADLTFSNIATKGHYYGGLVGRNHGGRIIGCTMDGDLVCPVSSLSISAAAQQAGIGGIAGRANGTSKIENCHFNGNITISDDTTYGGITGVKGVNFLVGGIVGHLQEGSVSDCDTYTGKTMDVRGTFNAYAGGIAGWTEQTKPSTISGCTNNMTIKLASNGGRSVITPTAVAGIVGHGTGVAVSDCVNNGAVSTTCNANLLYLGGIAAMGDDSNFDNCRNTGNLTHTNVTTDGNSARYISMGGIVAIFTQDAKAVSTVNACKNSGRILCNQMGTSGNTTADMAGIVGKVDAMAITISNCKNLTSGNVQVIDIVNKVAFARTALAGILGYSHVANTVIRGCNNSAKIYVQYSQGGTNNRPTYMGGIAGFMGVADKTGCSGLAGFEIDDCHSSGCVQNQNYNNTVTLEGGPVHGGIVGAILGTEAGKASIHDCSTSTPAAVDSLITGQRGISGGIAGYVSNAVLQDNVSSASVAGNNNATGSGGLVGWMIASSMSNSTFSGKIATVTGSILSPKNVGGLVYLMDATSSIAGCKVDGATLEKGTHASATAAAVLVSNAASGATITDCGVKGTLDGSAITLSSKMITTDAGAAVTGTYLIE